MNVIRLGVETPEIDKLREVSEQSQTIGEFLDTSEYVLARWEVCTIELHEDPDLCSYYDCPADQHLVEVHQTIEEVLAEYFGIDLEKVEAERRAILDMLRGAAMRVYDKKLPTVGGGED